MTTAGAIARSGLIVGSAFLVGRVLGWARVVVIGTTFGASAELDSFFAAFRIPDLIFQLVAAGALASALLPTLTVLIAENRREQAWRVASSVGNALLGALLVLALAAFVAAPLFVPIIAPGFTPEQMNRTVDLTRIMLASPILLATSSVVQAVLNAQGRFAASVIAPLVYNLAIILAAVLLAPTLGVYGLALGVVAGSACHLLVLIRPVRRVGFRWSRALDLRDPLVSRVLALLAPRVVGLASNQLMFVVATALATGVGVGAVSAFSIGFSLFQIPIGVIALPIGIVLLPSLSQSVAREEHGRYGQVVTQALRFIVWFALPLSAVIVVLAPELVTLLFGYGRFDAAAIASTAAVLALLAPAIASESLLAVLARAFYARLDTLTPVIAAVMAVVIDIGLSIVLVGRIGLGGISVAIVVGSWIEAAYLVLLLERRGGLELGPLIRTGATSLLLAVGAGAIAAVIAYGPLGIDTGSSRILLLAVVAAATAIPALLYLAISRAARAPELAILVRLLTEGLRRGVPE
ncbi:MAG TPA: murein biosynthesis integral membrane protein MurJ [Candidatus Eisenbacteria bacterium]|nr:murein biosynthesis integral membrane protein MurJ [Candidatus Eisenbacteria bacterium]